MSLIDNTVKYFFVGRNVSEEILLEKNSTIVALLLMLYTVKSVDYLFMNKSVTLYFTGQ